jgi:hypothetical protein
MTGIPLLYWFVNRRARVHPGDPEASRLLFAIAATSFPVESAIEDGRFFFSGWPRADLMTPVR